MTLPADERGDAVDQQMQADDDMVTEMILAQPECDCICHGARGTPGQGGSFIWDDDRDIRHEDWFNCRCDCEVTP